jgi:hypothetical protein
MNLKQYIYRDVLGYTYREPVVRSVSRSHRRYGVTEGLVATLLDEVLKM